MVKIINVNVFREDAAVRLSILQKAVALSDTFTPALVLMGQEDVYLLILAPSREFTYAAEINA